MEDKPVNTVRIHHQVTPHHTKLTTANLSDLRRFRWIIIIEFIEAPVVVNFPVTVDEETITVYVVNSEESEKYRADVEANLHIAILKL